MDINIFQRKYVCVYLKQIILPTVCAIKSVEPEISSRINKI